MLTQQGDQGSIRAGPTSRAHLPVGLTAYSGFPLQPALYLDDSTLGRGAGTGLFFRTHLDPGKESFLPISPYLGPEVEVRHLHTINMEYAHGGLPGPLTVDGDRRHCFPHFMNHVWDPSRANCRIQYCTDYTKVGDKATPLDPPEHRGILVMGITRYVHSNE